MSIMTPLVFVTVFQFAMRLLASSTRCFILLWAASFIWTAPVHSQSDDDVHIAPRNGPSEENAAADTVSVAPLPPLSLPRSAFRISVDLVLVPVDVSDAMNRPVISLRKDDFLLFDENKQQEIGYFSHEDVPISVAVLFDVSRSMADKIDSERAALVQFFMNANPEDEYIGITFSNRPRILTSPEGSIEDVEQKLTAAQPGGTTALLDAVYLAVSELRHARYQRKAIVIISDGGDNASRYTLKQIKGLVQESDVQIYAVGLFDTFFFNTLEERMGKRWLSEITDVTGGRTITVDDRTKLSEATAQISRELRSQYVLGYRAPKAPSSRWRRIRVQVTSTAYRHPLRVHYKAGYITAE
jgi:Ca-activated chloride channel family protein